MSALADPCPLPSTIKKRGLNEKEKLLYAPMADVGEMLYDKDAVYINIPEHQVQFTAKEAGDGDEGGDQRVEGEAPFWELGSCCWEGHCGDCMAGVDARRFGGVTR